MSKIDTYSLKGVKTGEITLPKEFNVSENPNLLAQAVRVYEDRAHVGLRSTKTRSEVNRTTKKIYKQKGTGGARHGSRRANVFVGGGITFGPRPVKREVTLSDALKLKAKMVAFVYKLKDKAVIGVEEISKVQKTKEAGEFLKKLSGELKAPRFTFVLSDKNKEVVRFLRNIKDVKAVSYKDINAFDVFKGGLIIMDSQIFEVKADKKSVEDKKIKSEVVAKKGTSSKK